MPVRDTGSVTNTFEGRPRDVLPELRRRVPVLPWDDTDPAAWADRAMDAAPLLAVYGPDALRADLPGGVLDLAAAPRRVLSLQGAAAAERRGDGRLRDHALGNRARGTRSGEPQW